MATRQGVDANITTRLGADHQELFFAVKAEFDTDTIALWSGHGDITISSLEYTGAGGLLSISDVTEDLEIKSSGITIMVTGLDSTILSYALNEQYQNRPITILMGYLMGGANESAGTLTLFKGRMISLGITDTPVGSNISISCENRLVDLSRPSNYRYTKETQNYLYPNDIGLNRVALLAEKEIIWGKAGTSAAGGDNTSNPWDGYDINEHG